MKRSKWKTRKRSFRGSSSLSMEATKWESFKNEGLHAGIQRKFQNNGYNLDRCEHSSLVKFPTCAWTWRIPWYEIELQIRTLLHRARFLSFKEVSVETLGGWRELDARPLDNASKFSLPRDGRRRSEIPVCKRVKVRKTVIRREKSRRQSPLCLVILAMSLRSLSLYRWRVVTKCVTRRIAPKTIRDSDLLLATEILQVAACLELFSFNRARPRKHFWMFTYRYSPKHHQDENLFENFQRCENFKKRNL